MDAGTAQRTDLNRLDELKHLAKVEDRGFESRLSLHYYRSEVFSRPLACSTTSPIPFFSCEAPGLCLTTAPVNRSEGFRRSTRVNECAGLGHCLGVGHVVVARSEGE